MEKIAKLKGSYRYYEIFWSLYESHPEDLNKKIGIWIECVELKVNKSKEKLHLADKIGINLSKQGKTFFSQNRRNWKGGSIIYESTMFQN